MSYKTALEIQARLAEGRLRMLPYEIAMYKWRDEVCDLVARIMLWEMYQREMNTALGESIP